MNPETLTPDPLSHDSGRGVVGFKRARKTKLSRDLRRIATPSEKFLWEKIRNKKVLGCKFRRQHVIRGFIVDFYCAELALVLEIDGKIHENQKEYDQLRQETLELDGIEFVRIVAQDIDQAVNNIKRWITERTQK